MRPGWLALVVAGLAATLVFALVLRDAVQAARSPSAYAAPRAPDPAGRTYQNGNNNDNGADGDNADGDNADGDNEDGDNDDGDNDEDNDNDDDFDIDIGPDLPPPSSSIHQPEPVCSTPGQDTVFTSFDRKLTVRIPGSSPSPVRVELFLVINAYEAPLPPGTFVVPLVYEIKASDCHAGSLAAFPAEVALAIHYTDVEATSLDESRFVIGRLDMASGTWVPLERRANDPVANVVSATVVETGYYMVWEAR
jgi:hypothetical protein